MVLAKALNRSSEDLSLFDNEEEEEKSSARVVAPGGEFGDPCHDYEHSFVSLALITLSFILVVCFAILLAKRCEIQIQ
jgi:hypothetical protein